MSDKTHRSWLFGSCCTDQKGLHTSETLGPNKLHSTVLQNPVTEIDSVFAHLFQQPFILGEIPKEWSLTNISPLLKKDDTACACNYCPVSVT